MAESADAATVWSELLARSNAPVEDWLTTRVHSEAVCDLFLAVLKPDDQLAMFVEVPSQAVRPSLVFPRSRGFDVEARPLTPGPHGTVRIWLKLNRCEFREVFGVLVNDVLRSILPTRSSTDAVSALVARLRAWQALFQRESLAELAEETRRGLFGELWTLQEYLISRLGLQDAVTAWRGPLGEEHDFHLPGGGLEVKSTTRQPPSAVKIANLVQLDESRVGNLVLLQIELARDPAGASLPELVASLRHRLNPAPETLAAFNDLLLAAGYLDLHEEVYRDDRYRVIRDRFFRVCETFPRIRPSDVRPGVEEASYSILLPSGPPYELEPASALDLLAA